MTMQLEAPVDTKAQRGKIPKSDYAWPDADGGPKFPITTQAQVMSASRLLGRAKTDDATKATIKARIKRIASRKGFDLPKAWAGDAKPKAKKSGEAATATISDMDIRDALRRALRLDDDPDGDGDDDEIENAGWYYCDIIRVYEDWFVYSYVEDQDPEDCGMYRRSYSLDANGEAVLTDDVKRVVQVITYVDYVDQGDQAESVTITNNSPMQGMARMFDGSVLAIPAMGAVTWVGKDPVNVVLDEPLKISFPIKTESTLAREVVSESLMEAVSSTTKGEITGTAIKPGFNLQGYRYYPKETLAAAVGGFVGKQMFFDHPSRSDEKNRPERSIRDIGAVIKEAWIGAEGEIRYKATLIDPDLEAKVALMQERGVMTAMGTSVNYRGDFSEATIDGKKTARCESMDLASLDFVTSPGAWGDIARMESGGEAPDTERDDDMADESVLKGLEATMEAMKAELAASRQEAADERKARRVFETKTLVKDALATATLPQAMKDRVLASYEGAEDASDIDDIIKAEEALYEAIKAEIKPGRVEAPAPRRIGRVIVGNGGTPREASEGRGADVPAVVESTSWFLGKNAKSFEESFVTG